MTGNPVYFEGYLLRTVADDPTLEMGIQAIIDAVWPVYILDGHAAGGDAPPTDWFGIYQRWPQLQYVLFDPASGEPLAAGNSLALAWDSNAQTLPEGGWNWEMASAVADHEAGRTPRALGALSVSVLPAARNRGLSRVMLRAMKELGRQAGLNRMIAPVRPTRKAGYPYLPIEEYIALTSEEGLALDPWLRTHQRLGARIVGPCRRSMQIAGSVAEWQQWTGLNFSHSGEFAFPGGLAPVSIDLKADRGHYVEPNVWMLHEIA